MNDVALAAWARLWSPLVPVSLQREAWQALAIPEDFDAHANDLVRHFHAGLPTPPIPLLLHSALGIDGAAARETWVRIMEHLDLEWNEQTLPPDHLAVACEILACALSLEEEVLTRELPARFLLPWCERASQSLANTPLAFLPECFAKDLR